MGCNCGRRRAVLQAPPPSVEPVNTQAEALVASMAAQEARQTNTTDPATGAVQSGRADR